MSTQTSDYPELASLVFHIAQEQNVQVVADLHILLSKKPAIIGCVMIDMHLRLVRASHI